MRLRLAASRFAFGAVVGVCLSFAWPLALHGCAAARSPAPPPVPASGPDGPDVRAKVVARRGSCPEGMAPVEDVYCIDRWEASLLEISSDGWEHAFSPFRTVSGLRVRAVSRPGVIPQAYVSRWDADAACAASGKRLCSAQEWIYACRGGAAHKFPYGDVRMSGYCNDGGRVSPLKSLFGHLGNKMFGYRLMNDPRLNQLPGTVAPTGAHPECTNRFGVFDMVGNLHEWVDDQDGTFRGGYYLDTRINGDGCDYRTVAHGPSYHDYSTGFRCCADPR